ncbi:cyclic-phosphate processing receiver domain-containing protein [Paenibacillus sp. sgz302251]|uniref:cyclic-phosphate processing receiver domain-containing protein n=1 Tax=Paenibacillus sp. sgz302251 TaxID=3414493 RepID=UPI003C7E28FD
MNVFLDDKRRCPSVYMPARSADECIRLIKSGSIDTLSLDYNLGRGNPTGYTVVEYMTDHRTYPRRIIIHSASPSGRARMYRHLKKHKPSGVQLLIRPRPSARGAAK